MYSVNRFCKTAEPIKVPFGCMQTRVRAGNHVRELTSGVHVGAT